MKIDLNAKLSQDDVKFLIDNGIEYFRPSFCHYTGQTRDLRELIIEGINESEYKKCLKLSDTQLEKIILDNGYIPLKDKSDETYFLIPLEVLKTCKQINR